MAREKKRALTATHEQSGPTLGAQAGSWLAQRRVHLIAIPSLLATCAILAVSSLVGDSVTFDETSHLTAGLSYLKHHDYRFAPDHPPLAKLWCAWPLLLVDHNWPGPEAPGWVGGLMYVFGREWLFRLNDGDRLVLIARCMMVILLLATCLSVYGLARAMCGPAAALVALVLATFSPTLLAHGRLVTTDLPLALCAVLSLIAFGRLMQRVTWRRFLATGAAFSALTLVKFSWPTILAGPLVMALWALLGGPGPEFALWKTAGPPHRRQPKMRRWRRLLLLLALGCGLVLFVWAAVWTCYGWRYAMCAGEAEARQGRWAGGYSVKPELRQQFDATWEDELRFREEDGSVARLRKSLLRTLRDNRLLPEAYLYGFMWAMRTTQSRGAYLMGDYYSEGRISYFPIAFAIKTPVATMLLILAGAVALCARKTVRHSPLLLAGLLAVVVSYAAGAIFSRINIGHRHLLPLYPLLFCVAGASAAWWRYRAGKLLLGGLLAWLVGANFYIYPHYLPYFNELIGGPRNGHRYLADSNIDWGQDLKRLARYLRQHANEPVQLAYFGSADPAYYGIDCGELPSLWGFGTMRELTAGLYVASVTQLLGVYEGMIQNRFWNDPQNLAEYRRLAELAARPPPAQSPELQARYKKAVELYEKLRRCRLLNRLQARQSDDRVGYSLFVYRLSEADVAALTAP
jgi:4-amino-4-deoxy-L-arabinose transferase-like glycosyltransferase